MEMMMKPIDSTWLDDLSATVGFSFKEADMVKVSAFPASIRKGVMRKADAQPIEAPLFDPRSARWPILQNWISRNA
jgi:hypothetical protein